MDTITFMGIPECLLISNGEIEIVVTTQVGPRVLCYRFVGAQNVFAELPDVAVTTEMGVWKPYGGHRLWAAPEEMPRTYYPDNDPIVVEAIGDHAVRLIPPQEGVTDLQKELRVSLAANGSTVTVEHLITNKGSRTVELAPGGLTIMRGGGTTIIPQEPFISHDDYLLPARPMVLWHFTDLTDSRWKIGKRLIQLSTNDSMDQPQKIGVLNKQGWAAYYRDSTLFVKEMEYLADGRYPDYGSNTEAYTAGSFMELESLDVLRDLAPYETASHIERWHLFANDELSEDEEARAEAIQDLLVPHR
jgi:hypothetical protein